ncbi:MAG: substrate-binding domain-containing protein [Armatimonadota bacterium]
MLSFVRIFMNFLFILLVVMLTSGCLPRTSSEPISKTDTIEEKPIKLYKVAFISKSSSNPIFVPALKGAEDSAKLLSKKYDISIQIEDLSPTNEEPQMQAKNIVNAVNSGVNAIMISCSDSDLLTPAINEAVSRGVQVMTFDSDAPNSKRFAFYGLNDTRAGMLLLNELAMQIGKKGDIAILAGNQSAPNLKKRVEGVKIEKEKYPELNIVGIFYHIETPKDAAEALLKAQDENPNIIGWALIGGWPLFEENLLNDINPEKVTIVSIDALPAQFSYVKKGITPVLLAQPTYKWGYVSMEKIIKKIHLNEEVEEINEMELVRVDKSNLELWARQLNEWGYKDIPQEYLEIK